MCVCLYTHSEMVKDVFKFVEIIVRLIAKCSLNLLFNYVNNDFSCVTSVLRNIFSRHLHNTESIKRHIKDLCHFFKYIILGRKLICCFIYKYKTI